MSSMKSSNQKRNQFSRGGRGRGRGRGRGGSRNFNNRNRRMRPEKRVEPPKPKTKMELLRENNMSEYVRIIQQQRIEKMEEKYFEDGLLEKPKEVYIPRNFSKASGAPGTDEIRKELGETGWQFEDGEFLHPYTTATIHNKIQRSCNDGVISVPAYYTQMDDQGVSSNIMDSDNMPIFFSENTYVCELDKGSQRYTVKRHEFNDFWSTRRGKRCDKKYAYMEKRKKRREHFQALKQHELKRERDLQAAKRNMRS